MKTFGPYAEFSLGGHVVTVWEDDIQRLRDAQSRALEGLFSVVDAEINAGARERDAVSRKIRLKYGEE